MTEVLKEWLSERLQRPIKWEADEFGDMMKNGYMIAGVLLSYHVINDEKYILIRPSLLPEDIKSNWKHLSQWLRDLEIYLNDTDLQSIIEGRASTLLRLCYQLFLHLDKKDRTDFLKHERKMVSNLTEKVVNRFKITTVEKEKETSIDDLSRPLLNENFYIDWQRKKTEQVKKTYDFMRHKYSKMLKNMDISHCPKHLKIPKSSKDLKKDKEEMEKFAHRYPCKFENYTYEDLQKLEEQANQRKNFIIDSEWAREYMDNLHTRMHKKSDTEEFHKQLRNVISSSLWDMSVAEEETRLDTELAKKVMKLSQFEKQMCTQLMETKQQARNLFNNRAQAEREFNEQREQQFNQFLDNVRDEINLEVTEIDFERKRQNKLHKKLYAEKMRRKRLHYYEICYETMLSIVDYATKYGYFKLLIGDDIPDHFIHEWKTLFFKQQPIFDILDPMEDLLKEHGMDEEATPEEEIIRLELDRQEAVNESEFEEYHNYLYPWSLDLLIPNYDPESEERKYEYLGNRILGHLVHTLLEIKYPYPPPRPLAKLPKFSTKVLLRGLPDRSVTIPMQILLNYRKIHVVCLEKAINFCLRRFKLEMVGCKDIELSYEKFMAAAQEEDNKELIRLMKGEDEVVGKSSENILSIIGVIPPNTKQTQTPKTIPEEEITLSSAADLGRYAYESLNFGDSLTSHLLTAMIVEYLKDQRDINGFVIINYPNSYREAQILEEAFSGCSPPDEDQLDDRDDIYLEGSLIKHRKKEKDPYKEIRVSKLVNNPHIKRIEKPFESYFTSYIHLKQTEDILQEYVIWDLTEENSEFIERFYAVLGINYSMYYEVIEKDFLAMLCKYIIGDLVMPMKSNESLFGENVLSTLEFPDTDVKRTRSKIVKPEISVSGKSREKLKRRSKTSKISLATELEVVKAPESITELQEDTFALSKKIDNVTNEKPIDASPEKPKLQAGEEDWDYGEIPIPEIIGVGLASCWEIIEKTYVYDLQQLFFAKRLQMNCLIPYARFIKDKMEQIITMPSNKQDLVVNFQKEYNEFENDWRYINLTKNEWHCRVKEFQSKLYNICDERKLYAERQRLALICENWTMEELTSMANTYISCMQTELNRCVLTFQALHDFYFTMIRGMPTNEKINSKELTKIFKESDETSGSKKGGEDKVYRQLKTAFQELQLKTIEIDYSNNPFNMIIENNVKLALKTIKDLNDSYRSIISREYSEIAKISNPSKKKEDSTSDESVNVEEIFKENALKCIEEWTMGVNGEMYRASLKMLVLQYKCYQDMKLFNNHIYKTFMVVQNGINTYYMNEIKSVDRLCKYLQMAVEDGRRIPETLMLLHDTFVIDPNLLQFDSPKILSATDDLKDTGTDLEFKISQLARLRTQFRIIAPKGVALQQAFIYLLQDFILFGKESCEGPLFPKSWSRLDPDQVPKLVYLLFGDTAYVDWRDFLIYCLNLSFPTVEDLLQVRRDFRCIDIESTELICRGDFINEEFWFDEEFDQEDKCSQLRKNLIKHFLFELYEVEEDMMNYSAFLLGFCKSVDPIVGFASALSMAVGKKICYSMEYCEKVVCKMIRDKKYRDECLACALKCTGQFLDTIITNVVNWCEGTTIVELEYTQPAPDKKGRKVKGDKKGKKVDVSQNTRLPKSSKSLTRKTAQSTSDVKTTFICRPCEDDLEIEEKPQEKKAVQEEYKCEPLEDTSLVYAVSQDVIWNVLRICLPWHFQLVPEEKVTPYIEQVKELMKILEMDTDNGDIYVCKFVSDPQMCKLLNKVQKFKAFNINEEVRKVF